MDTLSLHRQRYPRLESTMGFVLLCVYRAHVLSLVREVLCVRVIWYGPLACDHGMSSCDGSRGRSRCSRRDMATGLPAAVGIRLACLTHRTCHVYFKKVIQVDTHIYSFEPVVKLCLRAQYKVSARSTCHRGRRIVVGHSNPICDLCGG
jgi:hypothetical protein